MSMNIFIGNELYFKNTAIEKCINNDGNVDICKIDLDEQRKCEPLLSDMNVHLASFDFFSKRKVGVLRTKNLNTAILAIEYFSSFDFSDSVLIIDVFNDGDKLDSFKKNSVIKKISSNVKIQYFMTLKTYEEDKLKPFIKQQLSELGIKFCCNEDFNKSVEYIAMNSKLSYSCAHNEIKKLEYLRNHEFTYKNIVDAISDNLCTDRYYILDRFLESSSGEDMMNVLDRYLPKFKTKDLEAILSDLISFTKDYILFNSESASSYLKNARGAQKSNYYKILKLKFRIDDANGFLVKLNKLLKETRKGNLTVIDYLFLYIFDHFVF